MSTIFSVEKAFIDANMMMVYKHTLVAHPRAKNNVKKNTKEKKYIK